MTDGRLLLTPLMLLGRLGGVDLKIKVVADNNNALIARNCRTMQNSF